MNCEACGMHQLGEFWVGQKQIGGKQIGWVKQQICFFWKQICYDINKSINNNLTNPSLQIGGLNSKSVKTNLMFQKQMLAKQIDGIKSQIDKSR